MKIFLLNVVQTRNNFTFSFIEFNGELKFELKNVKLGTCLAHF